MQTNADCMILNRIYDAGLRKYIWQKTQIAGVFWEDNFAASIKKDWIHGEHRCRIFIPFTAKGERPFADAGVFDKNPTAFFTLRPEDRIVRGWDSTSAFLTIMQVITLDFGSADMQHWEVIGR